MSAWPGDARKDATSFGGLSRSSLMSRVRSSGNRTTEVAMARQLRVGGINGWRRHLPLTGRPDFAWPGRRLALFVHGCFWHGHDCGKDISPRTNRAAWRAKIEGNRKRDGRVSSALRREGWRVAHVWECRLRERPDRALARIVRCLRAGRS